MKTALIIGSSGPRLDEAINGLWSEGYRSLFRVGGADEALPLVDAIRPDLILVLPETATDLEATTLQTISEKAGSPIIVAVRSIDRALHCLGPDVTLEGPISFDRLHRVTGNFRDGHRRAEMGRNAREANAPLAAMR